MTHLQDYQDKYENLRISRTDGVLEVTLHTNGSSLVWSARTHEEFGEAFREIALDTDNRLMILKGTGDDFCASGDSESFAKSLATPAGWALVYSEGRRLYESLLDIPFPIIGVINGPAHAHAALALLSDIVIASDTATFSDMGHFNGGIVPGDGVHVLWPLLLGPNRGRYFLLTGQVIDAKAALDLGLVGEVMPASNLDSRAHELAAKIGAAPTVTLRLTRVAIGLQLRRLFHEDLGYGLSLEVVSALAGQS